MNLVTPKVGAQRVLLFSAEAGLLNKGKCLAPAPASAALMSQKNCYLMLFCKVQMQKLKN